MKTSSIIWYSLMAFVLAIPSDSIAEERKENKWGLHIAMPWINTFLIKPDREETKISTGETPLQTGSHTNI